MTCLQPLSCSFIDVRGVEQGGGARGDIAGMNIAAAVAHWSAVCCWCTPDPKTSTERLGLMKPFC